MLLLEGCYHRIGERFFRVLQLGPDRVESARVVSWGKSIEIDELKMLESGSAEPCVCAIKREGRHRGGEGKTSVTCCVGQKVAEGRIKPVRC